MTNNEVVTDKEEKILKTFAVVIPRLSEIDKSYLLGMGEAMAMMVNNEKAEKER